jgi:hypothetical protein
MKTNDVEEVLRSNSKRVSLFELSSHVKRIRREPLGSALRLVGTAGIEGGEGGGGVPPPSRKPILSRPSVVVMSLSELVGVFIADSSMALLVLDAEALILTDLYNATAPVTCGVAIDVPLKEL